MRSACRALALVLLAAVGLAPAAFAQVATGNIYGTVKDDSGAVLPGATVSLTGAFGTRATTTGTNGEFRFLNVDHGTHQLKVALTGFTGVSRQVVVTTGQNTELTFGLKVASVEETVTVTGETPVVDTKRVGTATTISKDELSQIPTSRDPWALMRTVPGVIVDRVNIAGSESGQQSNFYGKGADIKDSVWSLDGIVITDMAAIGSSPTYFTFDTFDEVNFSTGGNDVRMATGGIGIGLVTKRGTNSFHGTASENFTHDKLQWSNLPQELVGDPRLQGSDKADHTDQINDYSFDLGGPIVKDKLWFYGSYGRNDIRVKRLTQTADKTLLKNMSAKLNWQASSADMVSAFWFLGDKSKTGRAGAVAGLQSLGGTLWDQSDAFSGGPHGLSKLEWNHIFGPKFFLNIKGGYYNTGFGLVPEGGLDGTWVVNNISGVTTGTSYERLFLRPQYTASAETTYFTSGFGGNHELRFGGGWRRVDSTSQNTYPSGDQIRFNTSSTRARFYRDTNAQSRNEYTDLYVSDSYTKDRFTLNLGLRYDHQTGTDLPSSVPGSTALGNRLPALDYAGGAANISWNDVSPRAGFTYALDQSHKTVLRGSFARYAGQISAPEAGWLNPLGTSYLEYDWNDANHDNQIQMNEVDLSHLRGFAGVDPNNPGGVSTSPNQIDANFHANHDTEVVGGIERELAPNLAVSAAYTWRKSTDLLSTQLLSGYYWYDWIGVTSADYHQGTPITANGFTATPFVLNDGVVDRISGGALLTNRPDFSRTYNGLELSLTKRMANRWMGRAAFTLNSWTEHVGAGAILNPTHQDLDPLIDGAQHMEFSAGSGKNYYASAKWQLNLNGMYQLGHGFEIAANLFGRQGYPKPVYIQADTGPLDGVLNVLAVPTTDSIRLKSLWDMDLRLAKDLRLGGSTRLTLAGDLFNVFNSNTELYRNPSAGGSAYNRLDEILAPRILRLSAKLSF